MCDKGAMLPPEFSTQSFKAHVLAHAVAFRSRKRTKRSVLRCRSRRRREIDILENGTIGTVITGVGLVITAEETEALRPHAVAAIRSGCAECALCPRYRLKAP